MNLKEALCAIPDVKAVLIELNGAQSHLFASSAEAQFDVAFEDILARPPMSKGRSLPNAGL